MRIAQKYNTKQARSTPLEQVTSRPAVDATLDVSPRFQVTIPTPPLVILVPQEVPASSHRQAAYYTERLSRLLEGKTEPPPDPGRPGRPEMGAS